MAKQSPPISEIAHRTSARRKCRAKTTPALAGGARESALQRHAFHQQADGVQSGSLHVFVKELQRAEHEFKPRFANKGVAFALLGKYLRIFVGGNEAIIHIR